jgi:peptidoglycan/LPS O-acetylase OafA/YrhL
MFKSFHNTHSISFAPKYIPVINSLRGLAAVLVCFFHLICLPLGFLENTVIYQLAPYGRFGVQIFFVITGIVIPIALINANYTYTLFSRFMLKRILRIEPPYLFAIITAIIFTVFRNQFLSKVQHNLPSIESLLLHIGYLVPFVNGEKWFIIVFWTMAVEFQFYILVSLLLPLLLNKNPTTRLACYGLTFALALTFKNTAFALVWLPVFMLGIVYTSFLFCKIKLPEFLTLLIILAGFNFYLHGFVITLVAVFTLAAIHFFYNYKSKIGNFFGRISYSLYLVHTIVGTATVNFFVPYTSQVHLKLLVILLSFVISIIAAYVFYWLIESPFQKYASKISLHHKPFDTKDSSMPSAEKYKLNY